MLALCHTRFRFRNGFFDFAVIVRQGLLRCSNLVIRELLGIVELALNAIEQTTGKIIAPLVAGLASMRCLAIKHIETLRQFCQLGGHGFRLFFHRITLSLTIIF
ncbi:Uncharacterised protein [Vibrio cholerae]|nr:Uncharacterised protein [Vibrio cholerae]